MPRTDRGYNRCIRFAASIAAPLATFLLLATASVANAQPTPAQYRTYSANGHFCADVDPGSYETTIFRVRDDGGIVREWAMPGWFRVAALANDGQHLVTGYDGLNVVPLDYRTDEVLLRFWRRGDLVREVTLMEVVPDPREMIRIPSFYYWGAFGGFDEDGRYHVETVDHELVFDPSTGMIAPPVLP